MAHSIKLYEKGYLNGALELVYNAASQTEYAMRYGGQLRAPVTEILFHEADFAESRPVRSVDLDREFYFSLSVEGSDRDGTDNALARLLRWVDGANQPGLGYHMLKGNLEMVLRVQLDGATNWTDHSVKFGFVDTGEALFGAIGALNDMAFGVVVGLTLAPYGIGDSITLNNDLSNGDFLVESTTTGLGQDWSALGGFTGYTLDTTDYLVNGVSQAMTVAGSGEGVGNTVGSVNNGVSMVAFVWVQVASGTWTVRIRNATDVTVLTSKNIDSTDSGGVSDMSIVDRQGNTWYRVTLSGTNSTGSAKSFAFDVLTSTSSGTANIDAAYFEINQSTIPVGGWCSYSDIDNRADETNSTMGRRNWLDVALVPGDAPALVRHSLVASDPTIGIVYARMIDGQHLAKDQPHWIESADFSTTAVISNGAWTQPSDSGYSGGTYRRFAASGGTGSGTCTATISGDSARQLLAGTRVVYAQVSSDYASTAPTITFDVLVETASYANAVTATLLTNVDILHIVRIGVLNGKGVLPETVNDTTKPDIGIKITVANVQTGEDINFDGIWLFPTDEDELHVWEVIGSGIGPADVLWLDGLQQMVIMDANGVREPETVGRQRFFAEPGLIVNRAVLVSYFNKASKGVDISDVWDWTVTVWPRTRQLLGVT